MNDSQTGRQSVGLGFGLNYLPRREEAALHVGYQLGRSAVAEGLSILDVVQVHHDVLLEVTDATRGEDLALAASGPSEFLLEVPATYAHRGLLRGP